jgi:hypothetical protein
MKRHAFLAVVITLLVSGCLWAAQPAPSDGTGPDDTAAEYALTAAGDEPARGTILFEYYWGIDGSLSSLQGLPTFPNYPDDRDWRASLEGPTDWRDHYGTYVRGYLYPPATGSYTFWIASDDQSQLWLSKDESPGHAVQIASVLVWTPARDFDNTGGGFGGPQQKSSPIPLTAGKRYYIEVLQSEGIGGDNLAVAWQGPGIRDRTIIAGKYLSPLIGPQDVIDPNLIGWWKLDETSGTTAADSSGNGHDGAIQGTPTRVDGPPGFDKALHYNGQNPAAGWVNCGTWNPSAATGQLTATFWAKWAGPVGPNNWQGVVGKRNDWDSTGANQMWEFEIDATNNQIRFFRGDSYPNCGGRILPIAEWTHVAATFDGATLVFYIDGQETGRGAFSFGPTTDAVITIGCDSSFGWNSFNGALDDVRIYDRALLAGEIRWLTCLFQGEYFTNMTLSGSPALTRLDREINFNWGAGEVFPGTPDWCSVRWTGEVEPAFTEPYTFYVNADDGARLWLDDDLIINAWQDQAATEYASAPVQLAAGQRCHIRLEWYENTGEAVCELRWSSPSTPKQVIQSCRQQRPGTSPGSNPTMTLNPTSGPVGTTITITGSGYAASTDGNVISPWVSKLLTTTPDGVFSTTVTVPEKTPGGDYRIVADFPFGGPEEASATFTVTGSLTVSPTSGHVGDMITITGRGFAASTSGNVTLGGTSASVTTSATGTFSTTMTVPLLPAGNHSVDADIPSGGSQEASAVFEVVPQITLTPGTARVGQKVTITGTGFRDRIGGRVFCDVNGNWRYDDGEPSISVTTTLYGMFTGYWNVPAGTPPGRYDILADCPIGSPIEDSETLVVVAGP